MWAAGAPMAAPRLVFISRQRVSPWPMKSIVLGVFCSLHGGTEYYVGFTGCRLLSLFVLISIMGLDLLS